MGFQEKYEEYKQRQEAKRFFNQNNDYHLGIIDYIKLLLAGICAGTVVSLIFDVIEMQTGIGFSIFYLLTGYAVAFVVLKIAKYGSVKTGIICIISYLLGLWFGLSILTAYFFQSVGASVSILYCLRTGLLGLVHNDLITYLFVFAGAFIAYSLGKD